MRLTKLASKNCNKLGLVSGSINQHISEPDHPKMNITPVAYTSGIEKQVIERIMSASTSIIIVMAWFTNDNIKNALIRAKRRRPELDIRILVDNNSVNIKYFYNYLHHFEEARIHIAQLVTPNFLHHKFMIVDSIITISGSYNYTKRANKNLEHVLVTQSEELSNYLTRVFKFLTQKDFLDRNIQLLFNNTQFAQSLMSTYYGFKKSQYQVYKDKIIWGDCYTYDNGLCDLLAYEPGFIFNKKINLETHPPRCEFPLPIDKDFIRNWTEQRNVNNLFSQYHEIGIPVDYIERDMDKIQSDLENKFANKLSRTYNIDELSSLVTEGIDIIIEDDFWENNFAPFMSISLANKLLNGFPDIDRRIDYLEL